MPHVVAGLASHVTASSWAFRLLLPRKRTEKQREKQEQIKLKFKITSSISDRFNRNLAVDDGSQDLIDLRKRLRKDQENFTNQKSLEKLSESA